MGLTEASLCVVRESALLEKSNGDRRPTWTEMEEMLLAANFCPMKVNSGKGAIFSACRKSSAKKRHWLVS